MKQWTNKEVATLKSMLRDKATFAQIAAVLGRTTMAVRDYTRTHNLSLRKAARNTFAALLDDASLGEWVSMPCDDEPHCQRRMIQRVAVAKGMKARTKIEGELIMFMRVE